VVLAHARGGSAAGLALGLGNGVVGGLEFGLRQLQRRHVGSRKAVEAGGVLQHGGVAALLHIGQDVGHALFDGGVLLRRPVQARCEFSIKSA
jgi:hypothetical protein